MSQRGKRVQAEVPAVLRNHRAPMSACEMPERLRRQNPRLAPARRVIEMHGQCAACDSA